jgi:hypothetical protein
MILISHKLTSTLVDPWWSERAVYAKIMLGGWRSVLYATPALIDIKAYFSFLYDVIDMI